MCETPTIWGKLDSYIIVIENYGISSYIYIRGADWLYFLALLSLHVSYYGLSSICLSTIHIFDIFSKTADQIIFRLRGNVHWVGLYEVVFR